MDDPDAALSTSPGTLTAAQVNETWHLVLLVQGRLLLGGPLSPLWVHFIEEQWVPIVDFNPDQWEA